MARKKHEFDKNIETQLINRIVDGEYKTAKANKDIGETSDFETYASLTT